jgi:hypothetical protein
MTTRVPGQDARRQRAAAEVAEGVRALRKAASADGLPAEGIDVRPANAYEAVTRQMVETLQEDLREIKGRLNTLLFAIVGGMAVDVITRVLSR